MENSRFAGSEHLYRRAQGATRKPQQLETAEDLARGPSLQTCVSKNTLYLA
jgi:hypothetical protein